MRITRRSRPAVIAPLLTLALAVLALTSALFIDSGAAP
jgi:hypothetical protein